MDEPPRFVADVMLGRLARWLRALGYDTLYDSTWDDAPLADLTRLEQRILLTRDVELTRRRGVQSVLIQDDKVLLAFSFTNSRISDWVQSVLIQDDKVLRQLTQVVRELQLDASGAFTRCIECNAELLEADIQAVAEKLPPYVLATQTRFKQCPRCEKIYWRGTHWDHMQRVLREMENADE